ncbi:MAG: hypothetical protein NXI10_04520 [bacterium]|nr:hypothetical protein [bacterium]
MKLTALCFCLLIYPCIGQNAQGNYLLVTNSSVSFIQLNKDSTVVWYTSGCTDRGTNHFGTWCQNGDTVKTSIENWTSSFILRGRTLCSVNGDGEVTGVEDGVQKTIIGWRWWIDGKVKRIQRRRARARRR